MTPDAWALLGSLAFTLAILAGVWGAFRECTRWPLDETGRPR